MAVLDRPSTNFPLKFISHNDFHQIFDIHNPQMMTAGDFGDAVCLNKYWI